MKYSPLIDRLGGISRSVTKSAQLQTDLFRISLNFSWARKVPTSQLLGEFMYPGNYVVGSAKRTTRWAHVVFQGLGIDWAYCGRN